MQIYTKVHTLCGLEMGYVTNNILTYYSYYVCCMKYSMQVFQCTNMKDPYRTQMHTNLHTTLFSIQLKHTE